jgi:hypothetical protein
MSAKNRLIGADAELYKAAFGTEVVAGASVAGTWYYITKKDGNSVFPAGYEVGDLFLGDGVATFSATNAAKAVTFTSMADVSSFTLEFSKDEIEVTTLADDVKKYRSGKSDLSGNIEGINFIDQMKAAGSVANRFLRVVTATAANVSTLNAVDGSPLYCQFMIQKDTVTTTETHAFMFAQVELFGWSAGAAVGDAQTWSSGVRVIGNDPILYFKANA